MNEHRCDGRVAVVTGAGRGIGRAYARLLAERGASVVVNDLGGSMGGDGADPAPAEAVVADIIAAGGTAVADASDVSAAEGAATLVGTALDRFGRSEEHTSELQSIRRSSYAVFGLKTKHTIT